MNHRTGTGHETIADTPPRSGTGVLAGGGLPSHFTAQRLVCDCFGLKMPELQAALDVKIADYVSRGNKRQQHLPKKLTRVLLGRAERGAGRWIKALDSLAGEAIYDRVRLENGFPLFACSSFLTDELVVTLLGLYGRIAPMLQNAGLPAQEVVWILVEEVFVPTIFLKLRQDLSNSLGNEFDLDDCWYLPRSKGGQRMDPLPRVLQYWMRAAGFSGASHIGKVTGQDSQRKNVEGWLKGQNSKIQGLHKLVDEFAEEVAWTGSARDWKARLTLASAMQTLCKKMDAYFAESHPAPSTRLGEMLRNLKSENTAIDEAGVLASAKVFFAARLLERRMRREGKWENEILARIPNARNCDMPVVMSASAKEARARYRRLHIEPGNAFVRYLRTRLPSAAIAETQSNTSIGETTLQETIFQLGVDELNKILNERKSRRVSTRRL